MKTKKFNAILFIVLLSLTGLLSCRYRCIKGSGKQITQSRKVTDFKKLGISGDGFKVNIKQDSSNAVTINTDDNIMEYIHSTNDGDELKIYSKKKFCASGEIVINIGVKNLENISTSGGVSVNSDGVLNAKDIKLEISGTGKMNLDLNAANISTETSGIAEISLKGQATSHKVEAAGTLKLAALDFVVSSYDIETTGATKCEINVLHDLTVDNTGAADIKYRGNPGSVNTSKIGAATVTKIN